ncbi:MAG: cysteine hydrolase [Armatimonadetes bacterium]|nr:cysteine hydrolase [Armatimonadota bacterium]
MESSSEFLNYLASWHAGLPCIAMREIVAESGAPDRVAVMSVDMIRGFCCEGPLASPRVGGIILPIVRLFQRAHDAGVSDFVLTQDCHPPDAPEFAQFPPHCMEGTPEAETVSELLALPFASRFVTLTKRSISSAVTTGLDGWLDARPGLKTLVAVGNCTDLCLYQLAMHLRLRANALGTGQQVITPVDCVETYDMPVETARTVGALPHPGDFFHLAFLYHLALNGVRVVREVR